MKNRSLFAQSLRAQIFCGLLIAVASLGLTSCHSADYYYYKFPQYTFANRPIPPSKLAQRVMISLSTNGSSIGSLAILDAKRDIRSNIQNTIPSFSDLRLQLAAIPTSSSTSPPRSTATSTPTPRAVSTSSTTARKPSPAPRHLPGQVHLPRHSAHLRATIYSAERAVGQLGVIDNTTGAHLRPQSPQRLSRSPSTRATPSSWRWCATPTPSTASSSSTPISSPPPRWPSRPPAPPTASPSTCPSTASSRSIPGARPTPSTGPSEPTSRSTAPPPTSSTAAPSAAAPPPASPSCSRHAQRQHHPHHHVPTTPPSSPTSPCPAAPPSRSPTAPRSMSPASSRCPTASSPAISPPSISPQPPTVPPPRSPASTPSPTATTPSCSSPTTTPSGSARSSAPPASAQKLNQNYNCLTRFDRGAKTAQIVPNVTPGDPTHAFGYPNTNQNLYYYGDLTGLCWVQGFHKIYTAYGGQVHVFNTADGSEIDNQFVTVQGTALDVAYWTPSPTPTTKLGYISIRLSASNHCEDRIDLC